MGSKWIPLDAPVEVSIATWPWGAYLGEDSKRAGVRAKVSSWRRIPHDAMIPHAKASGQYLNSILANIKKSNNLEDETRFQAALKSEGMTMADLRKNLEKQMLVSRVQQTEIAAKVTKILRAEDPAHIEVGTHAVEVEPLDARVEVDQADGHAGDRDDRQAGAVALVLDEAALLDAEVERVGEDVDGVETDLLGHANAVRGVLARLRPRRVDEAEFHGIDCVLCPSSCPRKN